MNGNDVLEFYENNREGLEESWCQKLGVSLEMLDNDRWVEKNIEDNEGFWVFIEEAINNNHNY